MAEPVLSYGSDLWIVTKRQESRIQASEIKFLRQVKGCTRRDITSIRNDIRRELNVYNMNERLQRYKHQWEKMWIEWTAQEFLSLYDAINPLV
ncbi:hypothetical protein C0J52_08020 [Blattella germanica]|nr:hypothetical protein C0J52_08020 [Blattella germanica]